MSKNSILDTGYSPSSSSIYIDAPKSPDIDVDISGEDEAVDLELMSIIENVCKAGVEDKIGMETLVQTAKDGAEKTRNLESQAGRSRYVQGKGVGKIDSGAFAVYLLLKGIHSSR